MYTTLEEILYIYNKISKVQELISLIRLILHFILIPHHKNLEHL